VGGVINIITSSPLYDDVNTVTAGGGTQGLVEGSAVGTLKLGDRAGVRVELGGRSNSDFSSAPPVPLAYSRRGDYRGVADLDCVFQLATGVQLGLEGSHSEARDSEITPVLAPAYVAMSRHFTRSPRPLSWACRLSRPFLPMLLSTVASAIA
jgi:outer membrane receptor for ferrienterochelin and colicins